MEIWEFLFAILWYFLCYGCLVNLFIIFSGM